MAIDALTLDGVDALYGDSHVLHSVSFSVAEGRVLALLGRNGAGKTTCMNTVIGWLRPRRGAVRLFGEAIERLSPEAIARKGAGLVPQGRRVFPTLTVRENLEVAYRKGPAGWSLKGVFALFPRLSERAEQHAGSLSGGEQQMLAIGRALMTGTLAAGLILGIAESVVLMMLGASWAPAVAFGLLLIVLGIRPQGLFGR